MSVLQSADAMNLDGQSVENVYNSVKHLASQAVQNKMAESVDDYKKAEVIEVKRQQALAKAAAAEQRENNFNALLEKIVVDQDPGVTTKSIFKVDMSGPQRNALLSAMGANADAASQRIHDKLLFDASNGVLDDEQLTESLATGKVTGKEYLAIKKAQQDEVERVSFPEKTSGEVKQAYQLLDLTLKKGDPIEWSKAKRELRMYIDSNPGKDPNPWLEQYLQPKKDGFLSGFFSGLFSSGNNDDDNGDRFQHFTRLQQEAYQEIKAEYSKQGKGNFDMLPDDQVEVIINNWMGENGY